MTAKKSLVAGAVLAVVIAGGIAFRIDRSANSPVPTGHKPRSANYSKRPPARVAIPNRTSQNAGSSGDRSYFNPPTTGASTGNSAIPIENYFELWPTGPRDYEATAYFMNIATSSQGGEFFGMMYLRYADGRTDSVFPFTGVTNRSGSSVAITVTGQPTKVIYKSQLAYIAAVVAPGQHLGGLPASTWGAPGQHQRGGRFQELTSSQIADGFERKAQGDHVEAGEDLGAGQPCRTRGAERARSRIGPSRTGRPRTGGSGPDGRPPPPPTSARAYPALAEVAST